MGNELSERLRICIAIESGIAEIYSDFAKMFPEAKDLWSELARDEVNHASILAIGSRYANLGELPDFVVPDSLAHMLETLGLVGRIKARVRSGDVSDRDALEMSLELEQTLEEGYLPAVMTHETRSEIIARLQRLLADTKSHIMRIKDYVKMSEKSN